MFVNRENLATWCDHYGLWRHLQTQSSQTLLLQYNKNARAQVLQAYVGALYKESGLQVIKDWLEPVILESLREAAERTSEDTNDEVANDA
jgi:ribonuclease-3